MEECIFCKIVKGEVPCQKIGENEHFLCFLDIKPVSKGHALVVPKRHFRDFTQFPEELATSYITFVKEMATKIVSAVGADGFNLGMNNGEASGQIVMHQHTHIIPRFTDDGLQSWPHRDASPEELEAVQREILE